MIELLIEDKAMLDERYAETRKVCLVLDNLNTHSAASRHETFQPEQGRRLIKRLDLHYTPKHGSWLKMAEIELSALKGERLGWRIPDLQFMQRHVAVWEDD